jgi:hypothetical protein
VCGCQFFLLYACCEFVRLCVHFECSGSSSDCSECCAKVRLKWNRVRSTYPSFTSTFWQYVYIESVTIMSTSLLWEFLRNYYFSGVCVVGSLRKFCKMLGWEFAQVLQYAWLGVCASFQDDWLEIVFWKKKRSMYCVCLGLLGWRPYRPAHLDKACIFLFSKFSDIMFVRVCFEIGFIQATLDVVGANHSSFYTDWFATLNQWLFWSDK